MLRMHDENKTPEKTSAAWYGVPGWPTMCGWLGCTLLTLVVYSWEKKGGQTTNIFLGAGSSDLKGEGQLQTPVRSRVVDRVAHIVANYYVPEDLSQPVMLFEYVPSALTPGPVTLPFVGAEELHMSHLFCVGEWRWNKTCLFRNLYMDTRPGLINSWLFFASYAPETSDKDRTELLDRLRKSARVETNAFLRWEAQTFNMKVRLEGLHKMAARRMTRPPSVQVGVMLFERKRFVANVSRAPFSTDQSEYEPADGSWSPDALPSLKSWEALPWPRPPRPWAPTVPGDMPMVPPSLAHVAVADRWVAHSSAGTNENRKDGQLMGYSHECKLTRAAAPAAAVRMVCMPPGVGAVVSRPQYVMQE